MDMDLHMHLYCSFCISGHLLPHWSCDVQAMDRIQGVDALELPWEATLKPTVRGQPSIFKDIVLKLLNWDPAERPSMKEFCVPYDRVLIGTTTIQVWKVCSCWGG